MKNLPLILIVFLITPLLSYAADESAKEDSVVNRPKIGLVLKGGGALGMAHVGVLKVLEENRVPIDFVVGTSMGAIVGAAYASGTPVEEMERILKETDWEELFGEKVQRQNIDYRSKGGRNREIFGEGKIGIIDGKPVIPRGIVTGENIRPLFQRMFGYPPNPVDFDTLPVPFRAVTADVETGEAYIPSSGDLATVVRASMSIPGAFTAVEIDDKLLVDGGIANNLPIDVAIAHGCDIIIVVDLFSPLATRDKLESPFAISGQVISLLLLQNSTLSRNLVRSNDIVVEPDVTGFTVADFDKANELITIGQQAGLERVGQLKKHSLSESEFATYYEKRTSRLPAPEIIDFVQIVNNSIYPDQQIKEKIKVKVGDRFDTEKLDSNVHDVYQTGQFESVQYSIVKEGEKNGVKVVAKGKDWLQQYVRFGVSLEDDLDGDNNFRLGLAARSNNITNKGSYIEGIGEIGAFPKIGVELYQPFHENSEYFFSPKAVLGNSSLNVSAEDEIIAEYTRTEGVISTAIGRRIMSTGETSISYARGFGDLSRRVGETTLPDFGYDIGDVTWSLDIDNLDKADFPTKGYRFATRFNAAVDDLGASGGEYQELSAQFSLPLSTERNTFIFSNRYTTTFGDRPVQRYNSLGGFLNVSGTLGQSLPASNYNTGALVYFRRFSEVANPFFDLAFFAGGSYELTTIHSDNPNFSDYSLIQSGSVFIGADTPLLPIYLGYGAADTGDSSFYILFGRIGQSDR